MSAEHTTAAVQRFLDELAEGAPAEPLVRALLDRAVGRLLQLCSALLYRSYPRLVRPPLNLGADELLGAVVERLLRALRAARPPTTRQFFALACRHVRWELNEMARRLDEQPHAAELCAEAPAPAGSGSGLTADARRILAAIDDLPEDEREAFDLVQIQGMTQAEAGQVLGVSAATGRRRWVLKVVQRADPDPTGWRTRARDPAVRENPAALAEVIRSARISEEPVQLLLALDKKLNAHSPERLPFLTRIQQAHPDDFWAQITLGEVLGGNHRPVEAIRHYQAAVAIRPQVALGYIRLGMVLYSYGRVEEAVEYYRRAVDLEPNSGFTRYCLAQTLASLGRHEEANHQYQAAIRVRPDWTFIRTAFGQSLEVLGRPAEALTQYQQAAVLNPNDVVARIRVRSVLVQQGRGEEARAAWRTVLDADPPDPGAWYGYAELCLFIGREEEYRRARHALLGKFGEHTDPLVAARTARACLLLPTTGDELHQAVALAERAAVESPKYPGFSPQFLVIRALADYRRGRFDRAITTLRDDRIRCLGGAVPRLVLALALHRGGQVEEARKMLAAAVLAHDWRSHRVINQNDWLAHVLRREAEGLILPNLPAFLEGTYRPRDNDERLALLGVCQFTNRSLALARLCADAFAADPTLAEDFRTGIRVAAARAAALIGCGSGADAARAEEPERARWRQQARQWLRADLAAWHQALDRDPAGACVRAQVVAMWRGDPDLVGLFEPAELDRLPPDERKDCAALSDTIGRLLTRAGGLTPTRTDQ
jgi:serine/threonine-protein kinase